MSWPSFYAHGLIRTSSLQRWVRRTLTLIDSMSMYPSRAPFVRNSDLRAIRAAWVSQEAAPVAADGLALGSRGAGADLPR
jgi:hypothetical protein